jgi:hypothetical protein
MPDIKPYEENEKDFVYMKLRMKDACKYFMYSDRLEKLLSDKKLVPELSLHNKMVSLLIPKEKDEEEHYDKTIQELTKNVLSYFVDDKGYCFNIKIRKNVKNADYNGVDYEDVETGKTIKTRRTKRSITTYSSYEMIQIAVRVAIHVFFNRGIEKGDKKERVIRACYLNIINYVSQLKELSDNITHYKATVIAGYITLRLEFPLSKSLSSVSLENRQPVKEDIYNAIKHYTDPLKPDKSGKKIKV